MSETNNNVVRKGFRQQKQPTKGQVLEENNTLGQKLEQRVQGMEQQLMFVGNVLGQMMQSVRSIGPEVEALSTLEASVTMPLTESIQRGDLAMIDYSGVLLKEDGSVEIDEDGLEKRFRGGSGLKFVVRGVGTGQLIPGFEEALLGRKSGDTFEINATFPDNYGDKDLAKRKVRFLVTVHRVNRMLPFSPVEKIVREYEAKKLEILKKKQAETEAAKATQPTETTPEVIN